MLAQFPGLVDGDLGSDQPYPEGHSSRELEPLTSWQLLSSGGVTTSIVGPLCSVTTSAGACTVIRQR